MEYRTLTHKELTADGYVLVETMDFKGKDIPEIASRIALDLVRKGYTSDDICLVKAKDALRNSKFEFENGRYFIYVPKEIVKHDFSEHLRQIKIPVSRENRRSEATLDELVKTA